MSGTGKVRIYDLAKSLVPEDLSEKEKKAIQSEKTKKILEICTELGLKAKTASSSIPEDSVSLVMQNLGGSVPAKSEPAKEEKKEETAPPKMMRRVVRRVEPVEEPEPEVEEEEIEEEILEAEEEDIEEPVDDTPEENLEVEEIIEEVQEPTPPPEPIQRDEGTIKKTTIANTNIKVIRSADLPKAAPKPKPAPKRPARPTQRPNNQQAAGGQQRRPAPQQGRGGQQGGGGQPYRVARPPVHQFGGGFKKKGRKPANQRNQQRQKQKRQQVVEETPEIISLSRPITVIELSERLKVSENEIIRALFMKGVMRTINQTLDKEMINDVAAEFECEVLWEEKSEEDGPALNEQLKTLVSAHGDDDLERRPPVVTIMGHVDHGKTTLLDSIREAKKDITEGESGGITQHIGAYQVEVVDYEGNPCKVTFLDTPGHEAFTALRARGAQVTDIAILVVSADDGVMPQTIEAISHAKAAGVPIIIAVNKIDKPDANPQLVLGQLAEHDLVVEDYGGKVVCSQISAKEKINLDDLLSKITLVADIELAEKLMAHHEEKAVGAVIESQLSQSRGVVATLLIQSGTLCKGDAITAGTASGRVRAIFDDEGHEIAQAGPATPVQILGLDTQPQAGDTFEVVQNMQTAKAKADKQKGLQKSQLSSSLEHISSMIREGSAKELPVIIKADVQGSAEAVAQELTKISTDEVSVKIIHTAAGAVTESDINLAATAGAIIVNFNSIISAASSKLAEDNNVVIYTYSVIYHLTDAVKKALSGLLEDEHIEIKHGHAEVREIFSIGKTKIAGCSVIDGKVVADSVAKIYRGGKELMTLSLTSLKRFKDNAKEVQEGYECGIYLDGFHDYEIGDVIESWGVEIRERTLS